MLDLLHAPDNTWCESDVEAEKRAIISRRKGNSSKMCNLWMRSFRQRGHVITCAFRSEIRVGAGAAREGAEQPAARHNLSRFG